MKNKNAPPQDPPEGSGQDENQIIAERRAKLAELRKRGNPFPNDFRREHLAAELHRQWDGTLNEQLEPKRVAAAVAGRMMLKRVMGKASFATLQDMSGRIQIYVSNDVTGAQTHEAFKHWDLGETSLEYLRRLSPNWRVLVGIEGGEGGAPDDYGLDAAAHWRIARGLDLKFFSFLGLMPKATDWETQLGLMWTLPR